MAAHSQTHSQKNQYSFAWPDPHTARPVAAELGMFHYFENKCVFVCVCVQRNVSMHACVCICEVMGMHVRKVCGYVHSHAHVWEVVCLLTWLGKSASLSVKMQIHNCLCACVCARASLNVGSKWVLTSHKPFLLPDFTVTDCKRRRANKRAKLTVSSD